MIKELKRSDRNGIYLTIAFEEKYKLVSGVWHGFLTIEQVKLGYENLLLTMKEVESHKILVNHSDVVGPWQAANKWFETSWNNQAVEKGLTTMAVITSNDLFTQLSLQGFIRTVKGVYETMLFNDESNARKWLIERGADEYNIDPGIRIL